MNCLRAISMVCLCFGFVAAAQEEAPPAEEPQPSTESVTEQVESATAETEDASAAESAYIEESLETDAAEIAQPDPLVEELNQQYARRTADASPSGSPLGTVRTQPLIDVGRWIVAISIVIALVLVLGYIARRFASKTPLLAGADLGQVLGRIYLNRQAALFYVETGGRVLVIGVTNNAVSLVSEFDATAFDAAGAAEAEPPSDAETFLSQLEASARAMQGRSGSGRVAQNKGAAALPDDMASMKRDIERMRRMLAEED